jgi:methyl-galactoside transport system substrate-binding protein
MKRKMTALPLLLAAAAVFGGLSGCDLAGGKPRIGVALFSVDDSFVSSARLALEAAAQGKARLSVLDGQNQQTVQNGQIDAMIADKAKAIIVNPVDPSAMAPLVFRAKAGGVPVVFFSRDPSTVSLNMWDRAYFVGVQTEEADALQVQIVADYWRAHPEADKNRDDRVQYVLMRGDSDAQTSRLRAERTQAAFDEAKIEAVMVAQASADWTRIGARQKMADLIQLHGGKWIEAVFCANDEMALGVIEALKVAGFFKDGSFVPVIGVDGTRFAMDAIAEGGLLGTVQSDAKSLGKAAFDLAYALAKGEDPGSSGWLMSEGKFVLVPYRKVTRENYRDFLK